MAKALRWAGYVLAVLLILLLLAAGWIWFASNRALAARVDATPEKLVQPTAAQLADGPRQLKVLGCVSCHGANLEGKPFISDARVALLNASNLTQLATTATNQQLAQAIRQGIGHDGRSLLVMPSEHYQFLTDQELAAVIAAIRRLRKTGNVQAPVKVGPIGRFALASGRLPTSPEKVASYRAARIADFGPQYATGRHLVETVCSGCHGRDLKGQELEPGVFSTDLNIAGGYDLNQFRTLMKTGAAPSGKDLGLMARIARADFSHMRDDEVAAIHAYLVERAKRAP